MKPSQAARRREQHLIVFGDPKTGKSTLVSKLLLDPRFKLTWISMDNGHEIIFKLGIPLEELDQRLNLIILPDTKDNPVAIKTCMKISTGQSVNICDRHGEVDCPRCKIAKDDPTWSNVHCNNFSPWDIIVYDHLGQLSTSAMTAAYLRAKKSDEEKPEWDQYGSQGLMLEKFLTNIQQAKYHVICITHVGEVVMEDDTKKLVPLCGTTNFSRNTGKYFDHMVFCHMKNSGHRFGTSTTYLPNLVAGSRSDLAIEKMKEASLVPFFDGTVLPPESTDSKDAAVVLSSLSEKIAKGKEEVGGKSEQLVEEKEITKEAEPEKVETVVVTQSEPKPPATNDEAEAKRQALLAKLAAMRKK